MHFQCRTITLALMLLSAASCHRGGSVSSLKQAIPDDTATTIIKIPSPSGGEELILRTLNYQTRPGTPIGYRIVCSQPSERNTLLTSLGFIPADVAAQALAYTDADEPPAEVAALGWQQHPDLRCPADRASGQDTLSLRYAVDGDRTAFYLQVNSSPNANRTKNLYELGCKGIPEGMGLTLTDATHIDAASFISGSGGKILDMNCKSGQPANLVPFVNECEKAFRSSTRDDAQNAYVSFMEHMQANGFTGTTCTQLWNDVKNRSSLELPGLQLTSLAPFRYLTKLQKLKAPNNFITDLKPIMNLTLLQELDLSENTGLDELKSLASLKSLKTLNLSHTAIRDLNALSGLTKLEDLNLTATRVRLPNLDALKNLRLRTVNLTDLNLTWRAEDQTFFTNCFGLKNLPEIEKQSFTRILQKLGATAFSPNMEPTPSCFALYRDVMDASVWPTIDLSTHMTFTTTGSNGAQVTACLKPEILRSLNELPGKIKLDYENCRLNNQDLPTILQALKISSLDLHGTGLTDLSPLATYENIRDLALELTDLNTPPEKCPINTSNNALNAYCQSRRSVSIAAIKPLQMLAPSFSKIPLATATSQNPQDQIRIELVRSTCGSWLSVNDKGEAFGVWPLSSDSCIATLQAQGLNSTSPTIDITLQRGTPKITVPRNIPVKKTFERVLIGQITAPEAGLTNTWLVTKTTCDWLTVAPNGQASGTFPSHVKACHMVIVGSNKYGASEPTGLTILDGTPQILPFTPENGLPAAFEDVTLAWAQTVSGDNSGSIRAIGGTCISGGMVVNYDGKANGIWNTPDVTCDVTLQALSDFGFSEPVTLTIKRQRPENLTRIDGAGNFNGDGEYCGVTSSNDIACWGVGMADASNSSIVHPILPVPQGRFTDAIQYSATSHKLKCILRAGGTVRCDKMAFIRTPTGRTIYTFVRGQADLPDMKGIIQIATGADHACALRADGRVFCWGQNAQGQLGMETTANPFLDTPKLVPNLKARYLSAGLNATCAITDRGEVVCWGARQFGQMGDGSSDAGFDYLPRVARVSKEAIMLDSSSFTTCAVMIDRTVECWGRNQLNLPGLPVTATIAEPRVIPKLYQVKSVRVNSSNSCAVTTSNEAYCWGDNTYGQLGNGSMSRETLPIPTLVGDHFGSVADIMGNETACSISPSSELFCWGTLAVSSNRLDRVESSTLPRSFGRF